MARVELRIDGDARTLRGARRDRQPALVVVLESSLAELKLGATTHLLDRANLALVPAATRYALASRSPAARVLTLRFGATVIAGAVREYAPHVDARTFDMILATPRVLPRTHWLDELVHRYVFERDVCEKHDSAAARFLETELAKELYFVAKDQLAVHRASPARAPVVHEEDVLARRAREHIESHLFDPLRIADLARACHASESTLLRAFRRELGLAPIAYLRVRRLDEARLLLRGGRYTVSEIATRIGYASVAAFSTAFRRRFGEVPSSVRNA
jgi:AraC-like DNA-binding protein